jgi:hypothetical protein
MPLGSSGCRRVMLRTCSGVGMVSSGAGSSAGTVCTSLRSIGRALVTRRQRLAATPWMYCTQRWVWLLTLPTTSARRRAKRRRGDIGDHTSVP